MIDDHFAIQLLGTACGGIAAWAAIKVEVALAKQKAETAEKSAQDAHDRLDRHLDDCHINK